MECHIGEQRWEPGNVVELNVEHEGSISPYAINLDIGEAVVAPHDDDRYIRKFGQGPPRPTPARMLRFAVGSRVECNLGIHWECGTVIKLNYNDEGLEDAIMPYQVRLDDGGELIYAPADNDGVIRAEGTMQRVDPSLRFAVGDRVECLSNNGEQDAPRWFAGVIVGLHYHEPRFGPGVRMPYQVKLDAIGDGDERRLIFITRDADDAIRRPADDARSTRPPSAAAAEGGNKPTRRRPPPPPSKMSKARVGRRTKSIGKRYAGSRLGGSKAGSAAGKFGRAQSARPSASASAGPSARARPQVSGPEPEAIELWRAVSQQGQRNMDER